MKKNKNNFIVKWLYLGLFLIGIMVSIGGITRLTNSGLSMVDWNLISGSIPPLNDKDWHDTFERYKLYPEYQKINKSMQLSEFKIIFFWEYIHRVFGRFIGLVFIIPFIFFWIKNWLSKQLKKQLTIILLLGCLQAFAGWYMVQSGLVDIPAVSHYRLAFHLIIAFTLITYIYIIILKLKGPPIHKSQIILKNSILLAIFVFIQIIYGAFVAGLKAGYSLNGSTVLRQIFGYNYNYKIDILNNGLDIQAVHRFLAWIIFFISLYILNKSRNSIVNKFSKNVFYLIILQIILGITTLLTGVNIFLAVIHQVNAILLILAITKLIYHSNKKSR